MLTLQDAAVQSASPPAHILVMEDEPSVAKGLEIVLSEEGYAVDLAATGEEALSHFAARQFDLLVADLRLPDIDGLEVIRRVKSRWPQTEVVVITGYANVASAVDAMKLGTFDYLPKPFTEDEIKSAVGGALSGGKSAPAEEVLERVEKSADSLLIQKREVLSVLERTGRDDVFWKALMEQGSEALAGYRLSAEAKAAIASGDLKWIDRHIGPLPEKMRRFILKRLEREAW